MIAHADAPAAAHSVGESVVAEFPHRLAGPAGESRAAAVLCGIAGQGPGTWR